MRTVIIRLPEVKGMTGLGRSKIYALIAEGTFPKQVKLGCSSSGWVESEVQQWINDCVADRDNAVA